MTRLTTTNFKWSENKQVYPFHLAEDGNPLYCKRVDIGQLPNNGTKTVAHNIPGFSSNNVDYHRIKIYSNGDNYIKPESPGSNINNQRVRYDSTNVYYQTSSNWSSHNGSVDLIYSK